MYINSLGQLVIEPDLDDLEHVMNILDPSEPIDGPLRLDINTLPMHITNEHLHSFQCTHCHKTFATNPELASHSLIHCVGDPRVNVVNSAVSDRCTTNPEWPTNALSPRVDCMKKLTINQLDSAASSRNDRVTKTKEMPVPIKYQFIKWVPSPLVNKKKAPAPFVYEKGVPDPLTNKENVPAPLINKGVPAPLINRKQTPATLVNKKERLLASKKEAPAPLADKKELPGLLVNKKAVPAPPVNNCSGSEQLSFTKKYRKNCEFACSICDQKFEKKSALVTHEKYHRFECPLCHGLFRQGSNLEEHTRLVHPVRRTFKCHLCPDTFPTTAELRRHLTFFHTALPQNSSVKTEDDCPMSIDE